MIANINIVRVEIDWQLLLVRPYYLPSTPSPPPLAPLPSNSAAVAWQYLGHPGPGTRPVRAGANVGGSWPARLPSPSRHEEADSCLAGVWRRSSRRRHKRRCKRLVRGLCTKRIHGKGAPGLEHSTRPQLPTSRCRLYCTSTPTSRFHSNLNFPGAKNTWYTLGTHL
jgi:hypothetical protein